MRKIYKPIFFGILFLVLGYYLLGYASSFMGWYGYKKWRYRVGTTSLEDSKRRGVFVKELHFSIDSFPGSIDTFKVYIEKGFKYGHHSSETTVPLVGSNYPYQVSFNFRNSQKLGILMKRIELKKFDSCNLSWGYLKYPELRDTITLNLIGENVHSGYIKVWE